MNAPKPTVILTGTHGLTGSAVARHLAGRCYVNREEAGVKALILPLDIVDAEAIEEAAESVEAAFGPIVVWFNNAMLSIFSPVMQIDREQFRRGMERTGLGYIQDILSAWRVALGGSKCQQTKESRDPDRPHKRWKPVDQARAYGARGSFDARARDLSVRYWLATRRGRGFRLVALIVALGCAIAWGYLQGVRKQPLAGDQPPGTLRGERTMRMTLRSTGFEANQAVPRKYGEDGEDLSPPLTWTEVPEGTRELALIVDDPDAPRAEPWVHWVLYKVPADVGMLAEGISRTPRLNVPPGALQGKNSWGTVGYRGPAPPRGHGTHHYHFRLYALNAPLAAAQGLDKPGLLKAMQGHILAETELVGTYQR